MRGSRSIAGAPQTLTTCSSTPRTSQDLPEIRSIHSSEQTERVRHELTRGIMYSEERSRVGLMLEERGELVEVLRRNVRASPNTWRK